MITLGIETSCDETSAAVIDKGKKLSNVVTSSVHLHTKYGGVVPEIASRYHLEYIDQVIKKALNEAQKKLPDIELIAVTYGPGLCGSLLSGVSYAKALAFGLSVPLIGVNHLSAHIYANFLDKDEEERPSYPLIGLIVSGGHTSIVLCKELNRYDVLGQTQDDAVGEAFDKVAKILGLGYPGGPVVEKRASLYKGQDNINFPRAFLKKGSLDFSFSGIKTAVLYYCKDKELTDEIINAVCFSFQKAVFEVIAIKTINACSRHNVQTLCIGGGVAANKTLFLELSELCKNNGIRLLKPDMDHCLDNGAMIAVLGENLYLQGERSSDDLTAVPGLKL